MKHEIAIAALWLIALAANLILTTDHQMFTCLAPVYFVCLSGSIIIVNQARSGNKTPR